MWQVALGTMASIITGVYNGIIEEVVVKAAKVVEEGRIVGMEWNDK